MKKFLILALLLFSNTASAQLAGGLIFPGPGTPASAGASFTGPGDIVSGAFAWYSCSRGYNAADISNACNVCLPADATCADLTLSSGFAVVPGSLSTCNITTVICTVKTAYDKSGNTRDVTQATIANRPTFRPAMASNGCPTTALPCMLFASASTQGLKTAATFSQTTPITISAVFIRPTGTNQEYFGFQNPAELFSNAANSFLLIGGTASAAVTAADASWHAAQAVFGSGANSSAAYVDGTITSPLDTGTTAVTTKPIFLGAPASFSGTFYGSVAEFGIWISGFNATQAGNMNTNQHSSTNGYNF